MISDEYLQLWDVFLGTQGRVRNSRGKEPSFEPLKFYCIYDGCEARVENPSLGITVRELCGPLTVVTEFYTLATHT